MTTVAFRRPVFQDQVKRATNRFAKKIALYIKLMGYARACSALAANGQYEAAESLFREKMDLKKELQND
jgi:hypothetical protein